MNARRRTLRGACTLGLLLALGMGPPVHAEGAHPPPIASPDAAGPDAASMRSRAEAPALPEPPPLLRFDPFAPASAASASAADDALLARAPAAWAPELRATLLAGPRSLADLGGRILAIGEETEGFRLLEVRELEAVFEHDGERITLPLVERSAP